jgi:hypothetical protein
MIMRLSDLIEDPDTLLATLPESTAAQWLLLSQEPLGVFNQWQRAEDLLCTAQQQLPEQLSLSEALYKLYAYSNQFEKSLIYIHWVMAQSSRDCQLPGDPLLARDEHIQRQPLSRAARYYLYALKAYAFVALRQGLLTQAQQLVAQLTRLDPLDQVGGSVVAQLATRLKDED